MKVKLNLGYPVYDPDTQLINDEELGIPLWRYMPVERFLNFLITKSFYFPTLAELEDKDEGNLDEVRTILEKDPFKEVTNEVAQNSFRVLSFYLAESECDLMWRAFCPYGGVAVVSRISDIKSAFESNKSNTEVAFLKVAYKTASNCKTLHPIAYKRAEFSSEKEVRIIGGKSGTSVLRSLNEKEWNNQDKYISVEDFSFISKIVISPNRSKYIRSLVESSLTGSAINIQDSKIKRNGF